MTLLCCAPLFIGFLVWYMSMLLVHIIFIGSLNCLSFIAIKINASDAVVFVFATAGRVESPHSATVLSWSPHSSHLVCFLSKSKHLLVSPVATCSVLCMCSFY